MSGLEIVAVGAIAFVAFLLFLALFQPGLAYRIRRAPSVPLDSSDFFRIIEIVCNATVHRNTRIDVLTDGESFYAAELEAIRSARHSINLEAYIFQRGEVTRRFVEALTERARAGVRVNLVLDAVGSFATWNRYFKDLRAAGGRVEWYHPITWHTWLRLNNRTHRELIVIDGRMGFIGGAGFADHWLIQKRRRRPWRDTMFRVQGDAVAAMQSTFVENWVEASGEILGGIEYFPRSVVEGESAALIVDSSPSAGLSTRARLLYQTLIACARQSICITTPYFLPDTSARNEMVRAIRERGVSITVVTPGQRSDHLLTRRSSRRLYGDLLRAGARIFEYEASMIHTKCMIVDGIWSVVGSTNFDNRSFGLNDEVNLAAFDPNLAARLRQDFDCDVANSREVVYSQWKRRSPFERAHEFLGWLLERQQ